jgi:hypothetical protein
MSGIQNWGEEVFVIGIGAHAPFTFVKPDVGVRELVYVRAVVVVEMGNDYVGYRCGIHVIRFALVFETLVLGDLPPYMALFRIALCGFGPVRVKFCVLVEIIDVVEAAVKEYEAVVAFDLVPCFLQNCPVAVPIPEIDLGGRCILKACLDCRDLVSSTHENLP